MDGLLFHDRLREEWPTNRAESGANERRSGVHYRKRGRLDRNSGSS